MRDLLFKLLDEIEPNEVLNVRMKSGYGTVFLANKASILPLAIDMRRTQSHSSIIAEQLNMAYNDFADISSSPQHQYEEEYTDNHKVVFNNVEYVIQEELLDIEYKDDYFAVTIGCPSGIKTSYYKYDSIVAIERIRETSVDYIVQYNKLNYQYKKNKFN
jgi:cation transport regulator ChaB